MCCIITHDSDAKLPELASFENAMFGNRDGCGLAFATDHAKVRIRKWVENPSPQDVYDVIRELGEGVPWVFHARLATHGSVDAANTHPYQLRPDAALAHNGIITGYGNKHVSDTRDFIKRQRLGRLDAARWHDAETLKVIGALIPGSKFAVLNACSPQIAIVNRELGEKIHDGVWTSNSQGLPDYEPFAYRNYGSLRNWESEYDWLPPSNTLKATGIASVDYDTYLWVRENECHTGGYADWCRMTPDDKAEAIELAWELSAPARWLVDHGYTR